jgi:formyltetrahydrofolate deformylase
MTCERRGRLEARERMNTSFDVLTSAENTAGLTPVMNPAPNTAILLVSCPDQKGIVAAIANFIYQHGGNILHADQHQDNKLAMFFTRLEWDLTDFELNDSELRRKFREIASRFGMNWQVKYSGDRPALAVFVSRQQHCLLDLLHRYRMGELQCHIPLIVSNHPDARATAEFFGIEYHETPVTPDSKAQSEKAQLELLERHSVAIIVLARYMQVLSSGFVSRYPQQIINIHHSFLPAFSGSRPYQAAFAAGVKLIGATCHYVTHVLDVGPIIEQEVIRVSHRDQVGDLIQKGRDLERVVLARSVRWHLDNRILCYGAKTVVF